jgi:hypothetical protein
VLLHLILTETEIQRQILVTLSNKNFTKICSVILKLLHADSWTDSHSEANMHTFTTFHCEHAKRTIAAASGLF